MANYYSMICYDNVVEVIYINYTIKLSFFNT